MTEVSFSESLDRLKESFLWAAAQGGNSQDCESLIEIGADVNWKNADGDTPLIAACRRGHSETISLLLAHGADSNISGTDSCTPLHICTRRGDAESVNVLLNANTSTTIRTRDGQTALDIARSKGFESIYSRLMEKRSGLPRQQQLAGFDASTALINNVRNELPSVMQNRSTASDLASASANAIGPQSRKMQTLGRLIHHTTSGTSSDPEDALDSSFSSNSGRSKRTAPPVAAGTSGAWVNNAGQPPPAEAKSDSSSVSDRDRAERSSTSQQRSRALGASAAGSAGSTDAKSERTLKEKENSTVSSSRDGRVTASNTSSKAPSASNGSLSTSKGAAAVPISTAGGNYSIIGQQQGGSGAAAGDETATIALRKILDQEKAARKALEAKLEVFRDHNAQLLTEFASLTQQLTESQDEYALLEHHLNRLLGESGALESASVEECDELEKTLKLSLERIETKKAALIRDQMGNQKEQRLCVICQENEKSVVLLPCRHLCLCDTCSVHDLLSNCPLCREPIVHKISVFA